MTPNLDALSAYVVEQQRLARQHRPRKAHWRAFRDARTAQLRRCVAKRKGFWRRCLTILREGLPA